MRYLGLLLLLTVILLLAAACEDGESTKTLSGGSLDLDAQTSGTPTRTANPEGSGSTDSELPEDVRKALSGEPSSEWTLVNVPGWDRQPGFYLRIPPGWRVIQKQGIDSYVGEVLGDGVTLHFDYGGFSWGPDPADDPEHDYAVVYEDIGGVEGKLLIPVDSSGGFTGVYFERLDGPSLNLVGHDLTPEQQRTAITIFRSIRSGNISGGSSIQGLKAQAPTPVGFMRSSGPVKFTISYKGVGYEYAAGPLREDLLDVDRLRPTGLVLGDEGPLLEGSEGKRVYTLPGVPIEQEFLVRSINRGYGPRPAGGTGGTSYPVCQQGVGAYVYTAEGASPPPWWPSSPQPAYPGGPTPTPVPTPDLPVVATALSSEGLLEVGWPVVNMERLRFEFQGIEYDYVGSGYVNDRGADTSISPDEIKEVETLFITHFIDLGPMPSPALEEITSDGTVTDHVPVYRLADRPASEVIVVDQCPGRLQGDQFVLYVPTEDNDNQGSGPASANPTATGPVLEPPGPPGRPSSSEVAGVRGPPSMPAPRIIESEWRVDKSLIKPGEPISITVTLKNVWDKPTEIRKLPESSPLTNIDTDGDEPVLLRWEGGGPVPRYMEPGDEITLIAGMSSSVSGELHPGRYSLRFDLRFATEPGNPKRGETRMSFAGGRFVVIPAEGPLDTTVVVGQAREANGARITLKTILFTPEKTTIEVLAAGLPDRATVSDPAPPRPGPTATPITPQGTPTPTAVPVPPDRDVGKLVARYRIDGGRWHRLRGHGYRMTPEGTMHKWSLGPVSTNANTFELVIASDASAGSSEALLWEWVVRLREQRE